MHSHMLLRQGSPVNVAGKVKVGYRADIIYTDHVEGNNRIGCTRLQKISVRGMKIETLYRNTLERSLKSSWLPVYKCECGSPG